MIIEWSDIGKYHIDKNKENEDVIVSLKDSGNAVITLCDGVSTCENSRTGACITGKSLSWFFLNKRSILEKFDASTIADVTVSHILYDLSKEAKREGVSLQSLSSTAAAVLYDDDTKKLLCLNIGDALIGAVCDDKVEILIKPQNGYNGSFVTTTRYVDKVAKVLQVDSGRYKAVFICSDGMWEQFYKNDKIDLKIRDYLLKSDYEALLKQIRDDRGFDDRSFVIMKLDKGELNKNE